MMTRCSIVGQLWCLTTRRTNEGPETCGMEEVARRIAHEIKNPITPIKLNAQRILRRYHKQLPQNKRGVPILHETILSQVDVLSDLVNEFSQFSRMKLSGNSPDVK